MSRHWPSGDFFGVEAIILAHTLLYNPYNQSDTETTLPYRKKVEQRLVDVETAVVEISSDSAGSVFFRCYSSLAFRWKIKLLGSANGNYLGALLLFGGIRRNLQEPCRDPVHLQLGEDFCGCGIKTDDGAEGRDVKHNSKGCLMPRDWAMKMWGRTGF
ncbi:hypothetical protein BDZ89DRAFT_1173140 [Hymenopellis radicata]|nr:hypothetical protein BDZ89DRAFT_1173140 [Hymenopellis radicata]